jgi:glutaconate CoA-transferase, subunit B
MSPRSPKSDKLAQSSTDATLPELLAVYVSHQLRDTDVGFTGMVNGDASALFGSMIPLAAMYLAKLTHAPNMTVLLAGWLHNPDISKLDVIPDSEFLADLRDLDADAIYNEYPPQYSVKRGDITVGFSNGAQVDMYGNMNSVCIGDHARPKVRLVGPIFQTEHLAFFGREIIMMPHHDRRNFVEKVDYISAVGYPGGAKGRRALGLTVGSGPALVITPLCVFDFDLESGLMRVKSIHPGVRPDEVVDRTGFDLGKLSAVPVTPQPSNEELSVLRNAVDPRGLLLPRTVQLNAVAQR